MRGLLLEKTAGGRITACHFVKDVWHRTGRQLAVASLENHSSTSRLVSLVGLQFTHNPQLLGRGVFAAPREPWPAFVLQSSVCTRVYSSSGIRRYSSTPGGG